MQESAAPQEELFGRDEYQVRLQSFEGPLDLLLHLIRKNEVNIYDIPISDITKQYLEYLNLMKELNLEIAGEFLVMASSLLQIKSRLLLPQYDDEELEEEEEDPRAELVRRLLEYQRYKEAALELKDREMLEREVFARKFRASELDELETEEEPLEVEVFQLVQAFRAILAKAPKEIFHEVAAENISITQRINDILTLMESREMTRFEELFEGGFTREFLVVTFLAVLELCKMKILKVRQEVQCGPIWILKAVEGQGEALDA